ncbi:MAG: DUF3322 domain-containing protein [Pseudomonadota bacterium]|nr:DUF3322 domain-containing protein [Pseudomonadota bacterium]
MKSPAHLTTQLRRQWNDGARRARQLLEGPWPLELPIPWPSVAELEGQLDAVRDHVRAWRAVPAGQVRWQSRAYRGTGQPIDLPRAWVLSTPGDWVAAMQDGAAASGYARLNRLAALPEVRARPVWLPLLVRQRAVLNEPDVAELIRAIQLAARLSPGCAQGLPLRALPHAGVDSKFWARQRALLTLLLEAAHPGQVAPVGLEAFLGADPSGTHWLDVVDLGGGLLPWPRLRVRAEDLAAHAPPGTALLLVENHQCLHHLPPRGSAPGLVAVLGSGLDLAWLAAPWLRQRRVAYWGDIDTWGLVMLARARQALPGLTALLMNEAVWHRHRRQAVAEPVRAEPAPPGLNAIEQRLDALLRQHPAQGRLEQERLPAAWVRDALARWHAHAHARRGSGRGGYSG